MRQDADGDMKMCTVIFSFISQKAVVKPRSRKTKSNSRFPSDILQLLKVSQTHRQLVSEAGCTH